MTSQGVVKMMMALPLSLSLSLSPLLFVYERTVGTEKGEGEGEISHDGC